MPLNAGDNTASAGMAKAIYDTMKAELTPLFASADVDMEPVEKAWKKISYAIAYGVIFHIKNNMEIIGIKTTWSDSTELTGTATEGTTTHTHPVTLTGPQTGVEFTQSNDGTGHVE
jgi:hypothetical protein